MVNDSAQYRDKVSQLISWGHWFCFFNIFVAMALGSRYILHSQMPDSVLGYAYMGLSWVGHFGFISFLVYLLILFPTTFVIPSQRLMRLFAVLVATLGLTTLLLDTHAYKTLNLHLSPVVWNLLISGERTEANANWQYLFVSMPIIFLLQMVLSELLWKKLRKLSRRHLGLPIGIVFSFCFISSHLIYAWGDAQLDLNITRQKDNFPLAYPMTAKSLMEKYGLLDRSDYVRRRQALEISTSNEMQYPLQPLTILPPKDAQNVVLLLVDNLRADTANPIVMPEMSAFAQQSLAFQQHFSNSNRSQESLFGLYYGLPASYQKSAYNAETAPIMLETLQDQGYQISLFGNENAKSSLFQQELFAALNIDTIVQSPNDNSTIEHWQQWWLAQQDNEQTAPQFSVITLSALSQFEAQRGDGYIKAPSSYKQEAILKSHYQLVASEVDKNIAQIVQTLQPHLSNTVVIITADQGLEFNDTNSNRWGVGSNYSRYQLQVPMIIYRPGQKGDVVQRHTHHLDFAPTLMSNLLGVETDPTLYSSGHNLFAPRIKRNWIMAGDEHDIALINAETTTVIDDEGRFTVFDNHYRPMSNPDSANLTNLIQAMEELKRFYRTERD
ncbi:DUF3413 domain-containing protein [Thaumasiovibrio sp. DFM-14]|uniref:DUF3413 domain-containing protein n=1 Tax=Thaumasiovibrio sp. DFM-14 TaxID=3384792 RepID=UPI0039A32928